MKHRKQFKGEIERERCQGTCPRSRVGAWVFANPSPMPEMRKGEMKLGDQKKDGRKEKEKGEYFGWSTNEKPFGTSSQLVASHATRHM